MWFRTEVNTILNLNHAHQIQVGSDHNVIMYTASSGSNYDGDGGNYYILAQCKSDQDAEYFVKRLFEVMELCEKRKTTFINYKEITR